MLLDEIFRFVQVMALGLHSLQELLFFHRPEVAFFCGFTYRASQTSLLRKLALKRTLLRFSRRVGRDTSSSEVVKHLARYFLKGLFRQHHRIVLEFSERHELHNVCSHLLLVFLRIERYFISIELVHSRKVGVAHADNDDREG